MNEFLNFRASYLILLFNCLIVSTFIFARLLVNIIVRFRKKIDFHIDIQINVKDIRRHYQKHIIIIEFVY